MNEQHTREKNMTTNKIYNYYWYTLVTYNLWLLRRNMRITWSKEQIKKKKYPKENELEDWQNTGCWCNEQKKRAPKICLYTKLIFLIISAIGQCKSTRFGHIFWPMYNYVMCHFILVRFARFMSIQNTLFSHWLIEPFRCSILLLFGCAFRSVCESNATFHILLLRWSMWFFLYGYDWIKKVILLFRIGFSSKQNFNFDFVTQQPIKFASILTHTHTHRYYRIKTPNRIFGWF